MANDLQTNIDIIDDFTQRLQVAVIGAEETTAKHEHWVEGTVNEVIQTANGPIKTLRGLIADWDTLFQNSFNLTVQGYDAQFAQKLLDFEQEFLNYLLNIGFEPAIIYQPGIFLQRRPQTVAYNGVTYYWAGTLPYTTTGNFETETDWLIAPIVGGIEIPQISFASGGNLVRKTQSVLGTDGEWYFWTGNFPKSFPSGSTLDSAGGVGQGKFKLASGHVPVRPMMRILATAAGLALNSGSFEYGATITSSSQVLAELNTGKIWKWNGPIPKVVDMNSTPSSSGGVGANLWDELVSATGSSGSGITIGPDKPVGIGSGHRWYCTRDGRTYVYYADGDSVQWVEESPQSPSYVPAELRLRESLRRLCLLSDYVLAAGSFENGSMVMTSKDVVLREATGKVYSWTGSIPSGGLSVVAGTDPASNPSWVDASNVLVRYTQPFTGAVVATQNDRNQEYVRPEEFGAKHTSGVDDTNAFHLAIATGKRLKLGAHTYRVNLVLTQHFDIEGQGMDRTKLVAFDKTKPVVKNMFREPVWKYPNISNMSFEGSGTLEGVGFAFGDITAYSPGDELIGRVRMTDVFFTNFDKAIQKTSGNIGNVFTNVSTRTNNYAYWARDAYLAGADSSHLMHSGADLFIGGQISDSRKMCFLVMDTTPGAGQWTFINTVLQFNPGGTFMWDMSGTSLTAFESTSFFNIWNEGNATAASVTIDGVSGPRTITPSAKFQQTQYGPDYVSYGKTFQHGTTSILGRMNVWGNERIALNLEGGGIGTNDIVDLAFSSAAYQSLAGAWFRSTRGSSFGRNLAIHTGAGISADFNIDGGSTIGVAGNTPAVATTVNKFRANTTVGGPIAAFTGPFSGINKINMVDNQNYNAALAGMHLGSVASTNRSLNASGTLNASGADYAEYMRKSENCQIIQKGDICGVNAEGLLTHVFDEAISFVVKSTDPAYVGGDTWGRTPEPEKHTPEFISWNSELIYLKETTLVRYEDETEDDFEMRKKLVECRISELEQSEPEEKISQEWINWSQDLESERLKVDRIAFSGQVPCNVTGAQPGDYIVPMKSEDGSITGEAVKTPSFDQYMNAVGKVWKVLEDGRAWIVVKQS